MLICRFLGVRRDVRIQLRLPDGRRMQPERARIGAGHAEVGNSCRPSDEPHGLHLPSVARRVVRADDASHGHQLLAVSARLVQKEGTLATCLRERAEVARCQKLRNKVKDVLIQLLDLRVCNGSCLGVAFGGGSGRIDAHAATVLCLSDRVTVRGGAGGDPTAEARAETLCMQRLTELVELHLRRSSRLPSSSSIMWWRTRTADTKLDPTAAAEMRRCIFKICHLRP